MMMGWFTQRLKSMEGQVLGWEVCCVMGGWLLYPCFLVTEVYYPEQDFVNTN